MSGLEALLRSEILAKGPMPFRRFMEQALYHPELGYYAHPKTTIGQRGDYFTNVSVGSFFARLLSLQFREIRERLDQPEEFTIVEQGAHDGTFARDVLTELGHVHYIIVEPFPALAAQQREKLHGFSQVEWRRSLEELEPFTGVHFSNELFDAMPVHLVKFKEGEWHELYVDAIDLELELVPGQLSTPQLCESVSKLPPLENLCAEINLDALRWIDQLSVCLKRGAALTIDYGHEREELVLPERRDGTLACYYRHRRSFNPLEKPGEQDITAHVEWTGLIEHATKADFDIAGFTDQHHFMVALGERFFVEPPPEKILRQYKTLMHPQLMGRAFKVLALSRNIPLSSALTGFRYALSQ